MTSIKTQLLAATAAVAALSGTAAQAQRTFAPATIVGAGASLPQNVVRQAGDCYGLKDDLGFGATSGTLTPAISLFEFDFNTPATDTIGNRFNCAGNAANPVLTAGQFGQGRIVQPQVQIRYLSTGSGIGVSSWRNNFVTGQAGSPSFALQTVNVGPGFNPYTNAEGLQYAVSETALSSSDVSRYANDVISPPGRASGRAADLFGPAIQIPVIVAAVAVAYDPVYAKERNAGGLVNEYRFVIAGARPDGSGGLRLTRAQYCDIFNGTLTNWNQLPANVVTKDFNDPVLPFSVPIRLVGRSETSGTTSLFTRAIARQCGNPQNDPVAPGPNRFVNSENRLPTDNSRNIPGTAYTTASTISPINSLSGAFFDKQANTISGTEAAGLFGVANGNDGVAEFLDLHDTPGANTGDRTLNGRIGYASPEQLLPATLFNGANGFGLNSASLQVNGTGTVFVAPDAKQANAAFTGIAPPQSKGTLGAYCTANCTGAGAGVGDRANPLDWVQVANKSVSLAAPIKGYPIVGTSNVLLYTCYSTPARREAVNGFFAFTVGKTIRDFNDQAISAGVITDVTNGLFSRNGLAPAPASFRNAITETFFRRSTQVGVVGQSATALGNRNLWIQDRIPTAFGAGAVTAGNTVACTDNTVTPPAPRPGA